MYPSDEVRHRFGKALENAPLYQKLTFRELFGSEYEALKAERTDVAGPEKSLSVLSVAPGVVLLACQICRLKRTFERLRSSAAPSVSRSKRLLAEPATFPDRPRETVPIMKSETHELVMRCTHCREAQVHYWIEVEGQKGWLWKVGQTPPWDVSLSPDLAYALGEADAKLYRRALINLGESYGLGACAYMRRVLENRITPLLEAAVEIKREDGATEEELEGHRSTIAGRIAEDKIKLANVLLPDSVVLEGRNVLELIYDKLSAGIHRRNEQECVHIAEAVREPLEYVIKQLESERNHRTTKRSFKASMDLLENLGEPAGA